MITFVGVYILFVKSGAIVVTVALNEKYEYEYNVEDWVLEFCLYINYNAHMMGGSVKLVGISFDL